jgi:acyl-CoA thioesterase
MVQAPASVRAMMAADQASAALGIELIEASETGAIARMQIRPDMVNGHAVAHGGMVFALADTAFACACNSAGPTTVAASAQITFLRPALLGDELVATAVLRSRFGRRAIYDVTVRRGDDVVAEFRGHSHQLAVR